MLGSRSRSNCPSWSFNCVSLAHQQGGTVAKKGQSDRAPEYGFIKMLRDVLVVAINKGQLPILLGGTIILVLVLKMPGDDASKLLFGILEALERHEIIGYVLSAGITLAWLVQAAF